MVAVDGIMQFRRLSAAMDGHYGLVAAMEVTIEMGLC